LKLFILLIPTKVCLVAPYTGAWIETMGRKILQQVCQQVAPYTGAWIETLKFMEILTCLGAVAPYTGAWIET